MRKHKVVLAGVTLLAASLAMSACGTRAEQAPGGEAGAEKVAKIGVIAPLSGPLSALGAGIKNRSEERRVGKECTSVCRSRWSRPGR